VRVLRSVLPAAGMALGAMMKQRRAGLWAAAFAQRGPAWSSLGAHGGQDRLPRRQGRNRTPRYAGSTEELALASWEQAVAEDWLGSGNEPVLIKCRRAVRRAYDAGGRRSRIGGGGVSKSAASRHFVALSAATHAGWRPRTCPSLTCWWCKSTAPHDRRVVRWRRSASMGKAEASAWPDRSATENSAVVQALIDNLVARGSIRRCRGRSSSTDRSLSKRSGAASGVSVDSRCQIHKAATSWSGCRAVARGRPPGAAPTWDWTTREGREVIRNLARRLEHDAPGVSASMLEGLDESSPSHGLVCQRNCVGRSPAPTSWRTS